MKKEITELYQQFGINAKERCVKPFCYNYRVPDQLGLCSDCFGALSNILGSDKIYEYSGKNPRLKITLKEALELLIDNHAGSLHSRGLRYEHEPCYQCQKNNSNPQKPEKFSVQQSRKK